MTPEPSTVVPAAPSAHGRHEGARDEAKHGVKHGATPPSAEHRVESSPLWQIGALAGIAALAVVLGIWGMREVDPDQTAGAGLIALLPPVYFVALALSLTGFVASLNLRQFVPALLAGQVLVTVLILHGADPIIHGLPRLEASYRHLGIADSIAQSGQLHPNLDAYFNWPGFFDLLGMLSGATGAKDLMVIATWAPIGINLLLLAPLLALATRITANRRHAWAGVWLFYLTSWVGQDYLAPQAYAFILLVTLFACLLSTFSGWAWPTGGNRFTTALARTVDKLDSSVPQQQGLIQPSQRDSAILLGICALILLAMTASHQLTPFAAVPVLVAFMLIGRLRSRSLPLLALALPVVWLVFVASAYFQGHQDQLFGSFGDIGANTIGALNDRISGSGPHLAVVYTRVAEVAVIWILAIIGAIMGHRRATPWLAAAVGALAPLLLVSVQPYGGELLLRLFLFSLPFAACLVALPLMWDRPAGPGLARGVALLVLGAALATTTLVTRYGNDSMETFSRAEIALVDRLYATAPPGSVLIEAIRNTPWKYQEYASYDYRALAAAEPRPDAAPLSCDTVNQIARRAGAYLIVTASQQHAAELRGTTPAGDLQRFIDTCGTGPGWQKVSENAGGVIFHIEGAKNGN
ncbi:hypothetical protein [Arthrobacter sp. KBS0702]|uniref:hypothetical protein n=1 Tax=Arthrobacter sp. KBS0702 TaxID=2578107 RepID=UPI0021BCFBCD|nr:hypothetical protein [Arthrobacter sp. KBS0702]